MKQTGLQESKAKQSVAPCSCLFVYFLHHHQQQRNGFYFDSSEGRRPGRRCGGGCNEQRSHGASSRSHARLEPRSRLFGAIDLGSRCRVASCFRRWRRHVVKRTLKPLRRRLDKYASVRVRSAPGRWLMAPDLIPEAVTEAEEEKQRGLAAVVR